MRTHYLMYGSTAACGRSVNEWRLTSVIADVDCARCQSTERFRQDVENARQAEQNALIPQVKFMQEVLDAIGAAGAEWANEEGLCGQYDEGIEAINYALTRRWSHLNLSIPERQEKFTLRLRSDEVEAADEDALWDLIRLNPENFIRVS